MINHTFLRLSAVFGFLSVALGAMGAHALRPLLSDASLANFETAVKYQFYHALALLAVAIIQQYGHKKILTAAGWLFFAGILCFSGSLFLLSTREIHGIAVHWLGPVTPLGGLFLMSGWALVFMAGTRYQRG
jgi:uncharacterized membrane protein YgdD (TMEM256/DUF423 family)